MKKAQKMKITKTRLKQIIKEELGSVLEEAKETPEWSSDFPTRRRRGRSGKSAHGQGEDPFSSPLRFIKGKLGVPRDKIEKFKKAHNITTGEKISDAAISFALYPGSGRRSPNISKKTMKAIKEDPSRVISALEDLSRAGEEAWSRQGGTSGKGGYETELPSSAKSQYIDTVNKIISGERR